VLQLVGVCQQQQPAYVQFIKALVHQQAQT
jgi:hypothetical protein